MINFCKKKKFDFLRTVSVSNRTKKMGLDFFGQRTIMSVLIEGHPGDPYCFTNMIYDDYSKLNDFIEADEKYHFDEHLTIRSNVVARKITEKQREKFDLTSYCKVLKILIKDYTDEEEE